MRLARVRLQLDCSLAVPHAAGVRNKDADRLSRLNLPGLEEGKRGFRNRRLAPCVCLVALRPKVGAERFCPFCAAGALT